MSEVELVTLVIALAAVVLAAVSAWLEAHIEVPTEPVHRKLLWRTRAYREHLARRKGR